MHTAKGTINLRAGEGIIKAGKGERVLMINVMEIEIPSSAMGSPRRL
jgi:hypothetical protein